MTVVTVDEAPDVEHSLIAPDDVVEELGPFLVPREHGFHESIATMFEPQ